MFMKHYALNRCEPSIEALNFGGFGGGGSQGRCEWRSEVFVKIIIIIFFILLLLLFFFFFFLGGGGGGSGWM